MNKFTKDQIKRRDAYECSLRETHEKLVAAIDAFNSAMDTEWAKVESAQDDYNGAVRDANDFSDEVADEIDTYINEKSENWQNGDRGQAFLGWRDVWMNGLEEADLDKPDNLEPPEEVADDFADRPTEPEA